MKTALQKFVEVLQEWGALSTTPHESWQDIINDALDEENKQLDEAYHRGFKDAELKQPTQ